MTNPIISPLRKQKLERSETFIPIEKNVKSTVKKKPTLQTTKVTSKTLSTARILSGLLDKKQYEIIEEALLHYTNIQNEDIKRIVVNSRTENY